MEFATADYSDAVEYRNEDGCNCSDPGDWQREEYDVVGSDTIFSPSAVSILEIPPILDYPTML